MGTNLKNPERGMSGLATTLVAGPVRLEIRIDSESRLSGALRDLRGPLIEIMHKLDEHELEPGSIELSGDADGSRLIISEGAGAGHVVRLLGMLARLGRFVMRLPLGDRIDSRFPFLDDDERMQAWFPDLWLHLGDLEGSHIAEALREHGIQTDADFLRLHESVPVALRLESAQARFGTAFSAAGMAPGSEKIRPSILVAGLPPWVNTSVVELTKTVPRSEILLDKGIEDLRELQRLDDEELRRELEVSEPELRRIAQGLRKKLPDLSRWGLLSSGAMLSESVDWHPRCRDFRGLGQLLTWLIGQVDQEAQPEWPDLLAARIGEPTVAPYQTLAGLSQGRTSSEWVRQMERHCVKSLLESESVHALMSDVAECLTSAMEKNRAPVPLGPDCQLSCLATDEPAAAKRFIRMYFRGGHGLPEFDTGEDGLTVLAPDALADFKSARQDLVQMVKQRVRVDQRLYSELMPLLERGLDKHSTLTRGELERQFIELLNWSHEPPGATARLVSLGRAADAVVVAVMARAGKPLNRKEIVSACAEAPFELELKPASVGNVLASLTADPLNTDRDHVFEGVYQVGHGLYACQADLPVDIEALKPVVDEAAKLIRNGRRSIWKDSPVGDAYQWHCMDLVAELAGEPGFEELESADESQRWYLLDGALRYHQPADVVNLQKGFWMARREDLPEEGHRKLEQIEVVRYVLQAFGKGRPMQVSDIRDKVARVQSLGAGGQLQVAASALEGSDIERVGHGLLALKS
jgi:hypothetical protein